MEDLRLRPLRVDDEAVALAAHEELARDGFQFLLSRVPGEPWAAYVERLLRHRRGLDLPPGMVPAAYLVAYVGPEMVGRVSVRFALTPWLRQQGGHIGYGLRPGFRGRGFAHELLRQALVIARSEGVDPALLVCDEDNAHPPRSSSGQVDRRKSRSPTRRPLCTGASGSPDTVDPSILQP